MRKLTKKRLKRGVFRSLQFVAQALHVLGDWIREREPGAVVGEIIRDARIWIGKPLVLHAGPSHFERYDTVGLRGAVARVPAELRPGGPIDKGRAELRSLLLRQSHGEPALRVSSEASWTLKAFTAGYARNGFKLATVGDDVYQLLMEGLESFVGTAQFTGEPAQVRCAIGRDGRRYITASPHLAEPNLPTKDRWWEDGETDSAQTALPRGHPLRR